MPDTFNIIFGKENCYKVSHSHSCCTSQYFQEYILHNHWDIIIETCDGRTGDLARAYTGPSNDQTPLVNSEFPTRQEYSKYSVKFWDSQYLFRKLSIDVKILGTLNIWSNIKSWLEFREPNVFDQILRSLNSFCKNWELWIFGQTMGAPYIG